MAARRWAAVAAVLLCAGLVPLVRPAHVRASSAYPVWVKVSVATLWTSPSAPRSIDRPALTAPVHLRGWLRDMSTADRRDLAGRIETQALYGERLRVIGSAGSWLHVEAVGQPSHRDVHGYPGWVPSRQTTPTAPVVTTDVATVGRLTAWLHGADGRRKVEVSIGTKLPVLARTTQTVTVTTPTHRHRTIAAAAVDVHPRGAAARPLDRSAVLTTAREFLGVDYLWGGRSGFSVDCSGFTELVYGMHGRVIPRDTDDQATAGQASSTSSPRRADLLLFDEGGTIAHVGFALRSGRMLHAPHTGTVVQIGDRGHPAVARRYV